MAYESVILVDDEDNMTGTMEKMAAHRLASLHRAISVFIFNSKGDMLLQKRAGHKYHSGGEWSNACCSHPRPGERPIDAAMRRLAEEMGMQCNLEHAFSFTSHHAALDNNLYEYEYDHALHRNYRCDSGTEPPGGGRVSVSPPGGDRKGTYLKTLNWFTLLA